MYTYVYIYIWRFPEMGVPPKSSILVGLSLINYPFWDIPVLGNHHIYSFMYEYCVCVCVSVDIGLHDTHDIQVLMVSISC